MENITGELYMKLGIAGYGFVGRAHHEFFKDYCDVVITDPAYEELDNTFPEDIEAVIICVATPQSEDGSCDIQNIIDVIENSPDVPFLIKSTLSLEGWNKIRELYPNSNITFSPEFLRAETAINDFLKTKVFLFGGDDVDFWQNLFAHNDATLEFQIYKAEELILAKYFRNSFLALKVAFFNQIYDLCVATGVDYKNVAEGITEDERIGNSHTTITEQRGFGGHCFPKDTSAICHTADIYGVDLSILEEARRYNKDIRKE